MTIETTEKCLTLFDAMQSELGITKMDITENFFDQAYTPYVKVYIKITVQEIGCGTEELAELLNRGTKVIDSLLQLQMTLQETDMFDKLLRRYKFLRAMVAE